MSKGKFLPRAQHPMGGLASFFIREFFNEVKFLFVVAIDIQEELAEQEY